MINKIMFNEGANPLVVLFNNRAINAINGIGVIALSYFLFSSSFAFRAYGQVPPGSEKTREVTQEIIDKTLKTQPTARDNNFLERAAGASFSRSDFDRYIAEFTQSPHPAGSLRQYELAKWLEQQLTAQGNFLVRWAWRDRVPHTRDDAGLIKRKKDVFVISLRFWNVVGKVPGGQDCSLLIGSHYDSKRLYNRGTNVGANDSGSSSAALLLLGSYLQGLSSREHLCDIYLVWFDGEESALWNWHDGEKYFGIRDNTYGSRHLARRLVSTPQGFVFPAELDAQEARKPLRAAMILDMIGSKGMKLTPDLSSTSELLELKQKVAAQMGLSHRLGGAPKAIADDHRSLLARGLPSLLLIDFNNLEVWHTPNDNPEHLDFSSVTDALRLAVGLINQLSEKKDTSQAVDQVIVDQVTEDQKDQ